MNRRRKPYSLQKRPANKKEAEKKKLGKKFKYIYYCQFRDEQGNYKTAVSTGESSKAAAEEWANKVQSDGGLHKGKILLFGEYAKGWWIPETCDYCKEKVRTGKPLSIGHIRNSKRNLDNNILPYFQKKPIGQLAYKDIKKWMNHLFDEGMNPASINRNLATLKAMFKEALKTDVITSNPAMGISTFKEQTKQKSVLSIDELMALFDEKRKDSIWNRDSRYYAINLLSASTGMRLGECLGLQYQYINFKDQYIEVRHSFSPQQGLKDTKNHDIRFVPLSPKTAQALQILIREEEFTDPEALLFLNDDRTKPVNSKQVGVALYDALDSIGINKTEREKRNVTFHSYRHLFNTICRSRNVPDAKIRQTMGHSTVKMTEHYSHLVAEDMKEVIEIQRELF